jgi:hypothetical protein
VLEEFAWKLFGDDEGKRLGDSVRQVVLGTDDPRFAAIGRLEAETKAETGRSFFYGWDICRSYSKAELEGAALFKAWVTSTFEPAGEECGTTYAEETACPQCGAGARQTSSLYLAIRRIPKNKDICRTIAGEIVVSRRVKELFTRHGITGAELAPIGSSPSSSARSKEWFQLTVPDATAEIVAPNRVGVDPFDDDAEGKYRCESGDLIGLNLLSEVSIDAASRGDADLICTRQFIGNRQGLLRPERVLLVSPKLGRLIWSEKLKGVELEVVHVV